MKIENKKDMPIGVFDSGVGGLTVAREIMRQLPNESISEILREYLMEASRKLQLSAIPVRLSASC